MTIPDNYKVVPIEKREAEPWVLKKHYAKRLPVIIRAFGLFREIDLIGVCTFGNAPTKGMNEGKIIFGISLPVPVTELNRLVTDDGLPKNILTYFVSRCLGFLGCPLCVVSYADPNAGHHGYIYQALGWIYTGESPTTPTWCDPSGQIRHDRHIFDKDKGRTYEQLIRDGWTHTSDELPKHRYLKFLGNKREVRAMYKNLKLPIFPYPKGDNQRYDASYQPKQGRRFFVE